MCAPTRDGVLEASDSARGGLSFFSWLGLASASHGLASVLASNYYMGRLNYKPLKIVAFSGYDQIELVMGWVHHGLGWVRSDFFLNFWWVGLGGDLTS